MEEGLIGFLIWIIAGCFMTGIGIRSFFAEKAVGFWANSKVEPVNDIRNYNHAVGKLLIAYGVIFSLLGVPLLMGQNSPLILLSILGIMVETIVTMVIYTLFIEKKYRKKK